MIPRLLTVDDVAVRLGISRRTVYGMLSRGSLSYVQVEGQKRIEPAAVEAYLQEHRRRAQLSDGLSPAVGKFRSRPSAADLGGDRYL